MGRHGTSKSRRAPRWKATRDGGIELSEQDGVLSLHLGSNLIQSAMRLDRPNDLEIAYTRCMMGFLLFRPAPREVLMIGLGGGSLAKFVHHHLPRTHITAVEINPQVIAAARNFFALPPESERLLVLEGDGAEYVASHPACCDVLLVDGFDDGVLPAALGSEEFFAAAAAALRPNGIMVMNLLGRDRRLNTYLKRIQLCFPGDCLLLPAEPDDNVVVFGLHQRLNKRRRQAVMARAAGLEKKYRLPLEQFVRELFG